MPDTVEETIKGAALKAIKQFKFPDNVTWGFAMTPGRRGAIRGTVKVPEGVFTCCPITAAYAQKTGGDWRLMESAADVAVVSMSMRRIVAEAIINAADHPGGGNPNIRKALLKKCGLSKASWTEAPSCPTP